MGSTSRAPCSLVLLGFGKRKHRPALGGSCPPTGAELAVPGDGSVTPSRCPRTQRTGAKARDGSITSSPHDTTRPRIGAQPSVGQLVSGDARALGAAGA